MNIIFSDQYEKTEQYNFELIIIQYEKLKTKEIYNAEDI